MCRLSKSDLVGAEPVMSEGFVGNLSEGLLVKPLDDDQNNAILRLKGFLGCLKRSFSSTMEMEG